MKRVITTIATVFALVFIIGSKNSTAKTAINPLRSFDSKAIVKTYLEVLTTGDLQHNKNLYADDFHYTNALNQVTSSKRQYLEYLKKTKGLKYNCKTSYEILDQTGGTAMGKAIMEFPTFTRVDYITLQNTKEGWKIKEVVTTYK